MKLTTDNVIKKLKDQQSYLSKEFDLKRIGLFGSYARGTQTEKSDIDIVAEFNKPIGLKFIEFSEFIENLFEKKTDILTLDGINGIRNQNIAQSIKDTIIYV